MEVVQYISRNLLRQTTEAMLIGKHSKDSKVVNRRGDWGQNLPPKLTVDEERGDTLTSQKRKAKSQDPPTPSPPTTSGGQQSSSDQQANQKRRKVGNQTPGFKPKFDAKPTEPRKISQTCSTPSFNSIPLKGKSNQQQMANTQQ